MISPCNEDSKLICTFCSASVWTSFKRHTIQYLVKASGNIKSIRFYRQAANLARFVLVWKFAESGWLPVRFHEYQDIRLILSLPCKMSPQPMISLFTCSSISIWLQFSLYWDQLQRGKQALESFQSLQRVLHTINREIEHLRSWSWRLDVSLPDSSLLRFYEVLVVRNSIECEILQNISYCWHFCCQCM